MQEELRSAGADALILFSSESDNRPSIQYLSGFTGSFAVLVVGLKGGFLVTDSRYFLQGEEQSFFPLGKMEDRDPWPAIRGSQGRLRCEISCRGRRTKSPTGRRSFQKSSLPRQTRRLMLRLRAVKDEEELDLLRHSAKIASEAFEVPFFRGHPPGKKGMGGRRRPRPRDSENGAEQMAKGHFVGSA
ncbi:hypothetical protein MASR2M79_22160 [Aminivibrio sp.]